MQHFFYKYLGKRNHYWPLITFILMSISLSGCTLWLPQEGVYPVKDAPLGGKKMDWPSRAVQIRQLKLFGVRGELEIHAHGHKGGAMAFRWKQFATHYQLELLNPLGKPYVKLIGFQKSARLYFNNQVYSGKNGEYLIQKHLGMHLPIGYFTDWLRGVPVLKVRHERVLTPTKHLLKLHQQGWFVRYLRYHRIRNIDLPTQLSISKGDWYARVLITHWQFY